MVMIQSHELEILQAKIREAEERLKEQEELLARRTGGNGAHQREGSEGGFPSAPEEERANAQSSLSSSVSDSRSSDEGLTDASASPATSNDLDERVNEIEHEQKDKARES